MKTKENGKLTAEKTVEAAENRHFSDRRKKRYIIAFASAAVVAVAAGVLLLIGSGVFDNNGSDVKVPTNSVSEHSTEIFIEDVYEHECYSDEFFEESTTTENVNSANEYYDEYYDDYYNNVDYDGINAT